MGKRDVTYLLPTVTDSLIRNKPFPTQTFNLLVHAHALGRNILLSAIDGGTLGRKCLTLGDEMVLDQTKGPIGENGGAYVSIAGIAGAEVDKLFETKGLDFIDREKAKRHAKQQAEQMYDHQYGDMDQFDP